jgi:hypothetical protein
MKNVIYGIIFALIMIDSGYSNEIDIKKIKDNHNAYYKHLFEDDMNSLAKLFSFPSLFKGFVKEVQIAKSEEDIKIIYQNLIKAAPQSKFVNGGRNYTEINTSVDSKSIFKMREDTYLLIVKYTQSDKKDNSLIFTGSASYLFIKNDEKWLISGVF